MNTLTRRIGVALTATLLATTAIAPMASAREWHGDGRDNHREVRRDHDDHHGDNGAGLAIGLGIAAIAGIALLNSATEAPAPVYQPAYPAPAYRQPVYVQPAYAQPVYAQPVYGQPSCTTINGAAACLAPDGMYHYVR
jgi:hypothetical protein